MFSSKAPLPPSSSILSLDEFYRITHPLIVSLASSSSPPSSPLPPLTIVMGNESSDFDSTVSASVLAWYLHTVHPPTSPSSPRYVPVINVPRRYFRLRAEIVFEYARLGVDAAHVTFIDDVDLHALAARTQLSVVLTDHNRLTAAQEWLGPHVVGVVDHHEDEHLYPASDGSRIISKSGSCCSHVTALIADQQPQLLSSAFSLLPLVQLLTDVILIDTHNMDPDLKKATALDKRALDHLTQAAHALLFKRQKSLRNDVEGWSTEELLLKDSKVYTADGYGVMISTVPMPLDEWQRRNVRMIEELAAQAKALDALIILTSFTDKHSKQYKRELLLIVPRHPPSHPTPSSSAPATEVHRASPGKAKLSTDDFFAQLAQGLEGDDKLQLKAIDSSRPVTGLPEGERSAVSGQGAVEVGDAVLAERRHDVLVRRYDQLNVSSSRKQVAPQVESILSKL